ncbi:uncharacterized protein ACA1_128540 [Acanthamoeba castellanii str. Neff]|uniref:Uncharacterized protein n=1 Tax=Acanthamoeba castellanii (strain ATCC 30010 / Neff) TaxID=1257118 RepID=L8GVJ1_ACACF|nr:uncharacterized protein ACA1_128540 [Acanthamoeba castellanii str. Neff]ELR16967.1 hypothetical protein ACA1_128540 [Acanthamoeba castellanii str. Neff]
MNFEPSVCWSSAISSSAFFQIGDGHGRSQWSIKSSSTPLQISSITLPLAKLKFCDESHFIMCQLHHTQVISPVDNPFYIDICLDSNSEEDFFNFVVAAVAASHLANGDFFIVDNASIHFGWATQPWLRLLFACHGILTPEFQLLQLLLQALTQLTYHQLVNMYVHCVNILERHK